jgi:hypothetical protein
MHLSGLDDLRKRMSPRLDRLHSYQNDNFAVRRINYWKKGYLKMDYCEAKNGYVCQRPAVAGAAPDATGII